MHDDFFTGLEIITSMSKAIKLHGSTHHYESFGFDPEEDYLYDFEVTFKFPYTGLATFKKRQLLPSQEWFLLFEETDKAIMQDDSDFYGIRYRTNVETGIKRLAPVIKKLENVIASAVNADEKERQEISKERLNNLEKMKSLLKALERFNKIDEIAMSFDVIDGPDLKVVKSREIITEMEKRIMALHDRNADYLGDLKF